MSLYVPSLVMNCVLSSSSQVAPPLKPMSMLEDKAMMQDEDDLALDQPFCMLGLQLDKIDISCLFFLLLEDWRTVRNDAFTQLIGLHGPLNDA